MEEELIFEVQMQKYAELYPTLVFLITGFIFFLFGDLTLPAIIFIVYVMGKIEKTDWYSVLSQRIQRTLFS